MHSESPGRKGCPGTAMGPSLWQMVPSHITYMPYAPAAPLMSCPLSVGTGRFASAAVGMVMHRCFGLSVPQFPHLRYSYHGRAARWDGCQ